MQIEKYSYREFWDAPQAWEVLEFSLGSTNLLVGRNASGKSRIANTISSLARFISTGSTQGWISGHWKVKMQNGTSNYTIEIMIENSLISRELICVNGQDLLVRNNNGSGKIWYERQGQYIDFEINRENLSIFSRRDKLQHSFLEPIFEWASSLRQYQFSTDLGRQNIVMIPSTDSNPENPDFSPTPQSTSDHTAAVPQYTRGFHLFGSQFDEMILQDLEFIGYPCSDVSTALAPGFPIIGNNFPVLIQVQERELRVPTRQLEMSTGMFRALAIIIHLNFAILSEASITLVIDDIGEGLDFSRSTSLIKLLLKKCQNSKIQLILTSNDRFVMNEVDLDYWHIIEREGHTVSVKDNQTNKSEFEKFKLFGLSNFDFFTMSTSSRTEH